MKLPILLLVVFLGAVFGQLNNGPTFAPSDTLENVLYLFKLGLNFSLVQRRRNPHLLNDLFEPGFTFNACDGYNYTKNHITTIIEYIPADVKLSFFVILAFDEGSFIKLRLALTGFRPSEIEADFILNKDSVKLESGNELYCQKNHFHGFYGQQYGIQDSARVMVEKFLARMERSIGSKDTAVINGLFQPDFTFIGCKKTLTKQLFVDFLLQNSTQIKLTFSLKSLKDNGKAIKFTVTATGFGASAIKVDFILNKVDQQLKSGFVLACPKSHFNGFNDDVVSSEITDDVY